MKNYIVLDTEGVDTVKHNDKRVHPETSLFYDLGFIVVDGNTGDILDRYSFINTDVFFNDELMTSAYYANKRQIYFAGMNSLWTLANTKTILKTFINACERYNVGKIWAYNASYDKEITKNTVHTISNGFCEEFTPANIQWCDIWDYAGSTLCNTKKYVKWCLQNNYISGKGNPKTSAEIVFRYITKDNSFCEAHTALNDCVIENEILQKAKKRKQKARKSMGHGWRDAASIAKAL